MSTTMLYTEGKNKLYWGKFFAKSAVFNDSDVEEALKSGDWYAHPSDVPQPKKAEAPAATPAPPERHDSTGPMPTHYQALLPYAGASEVPAKKPQQQRKENSKAAKKDK